MSSVRAVAWQGDAATGCLRLLDQRRLPTEIVYRDCRSVNDTWEAIKCLQVRGAPAIGIAAAYGVVVGLQRISSPKPSDVQQITDYLRTSRPTAVNLFWALDRMERAAQSYSPSHEVAKRGPSGNRVPLDSSRERLRDNLPMLGRHATPACASPMPGGGTETSRPPHSPSLLDHLLAEAHAIRDEDAATCRDIGAVGAPLISSGMGLLTHCNAGALATAEYGTALAVIFMAVEQGKAVSVFVDETRPLLQGARLTAWELQQRGIPATLICDNMAAQVMKEGKVGLVIVGADRIAANGDTANKIGTYGVAVLAQYHGIPFYVAAPRSTFDLSLPNGTHIPIEQRSGEEIRQGFGRVTAPAGIGVYNPAFDVTPAQLITGIITEVGLIQPVNCETIANTVQMK